jgi:flagellar protein FlaF
MYQFSYAEILDATPRASRERERLALERSIKLLEKAEKCGPRSREAVEALTFVRQLWAILIEDLARSDNDLAQTLRADLISIGLWVMREAEDIRLEKKASFTSLIEVSRVIGEGLQ